MNLWFTLTLSLLSLYIGVVSQPGIQKFSRKYKFLAIPGGRNSHTGPVPNIGGVSFYIIFFLIFLVFNYFFKAPGLNITFLITATIFLAMGLADDKGYLEAKHKLFLQTIAVTFFLIGSNIRIDNLFDQWILDESMAFMFTLFFILSVTNAYNLIDGIDGLAASMGILIFTACGIILAIYGDHFYYTLSFSMTGVLAGYLRFNLSRKRKVLMGDTGSMLIGFLTGIILLKSLNLLIANRTGLPDIFNPWSIFILLAYPLFDMTRVVLSRLIAGVSPFRADRLHLHHLIIDHFGYSHVKATGILILANLILSVFTFLISGMLSSEDLLIYYFILFGLFVLSSHIIRAGKAVKRGR